MAWLKESDLSEIKGIAKSLLYAVEIKPVVKGFPICNHPYTQTTMGMDEDGNMIDLTDKSNFFKWCGMMQGQIDKCPNIYLVYNLIREPYKLAFMKFAKEYMSKSDFSEFWADAWVVEENPNMDATVSLREAVKMFRMCNKEKMMEKEDYAYFKALPDKITVYRGVAVGRVADGLSWTNKLKTAEWFAHRFDRDGKVGFVEKAEIDKKDVLAYFNTRKEDELVVDVFAIKHLITRI